MSTSRTQQHFDSLDADLQVIDTGLDTSTVGAAAAALGVEPGAIAKTLAVRAGDTVFLLVACGTARLDNRKFKDQFGAKPRMLGHEETASHGQPVGVGVRSRRATMYLDASCATSRRSTRPPDPAPAPSASPG